MKEDDSIPILVHQLRVPLVGVHWSIELLLKEEAGSLNEEQKRMLTKDYENVGKLLSTINDVMVLSQKKYNPQNLSLTDMQQVTTDVIEELEGKLGEKNITLIRNSLGVVFKPLMLDKEKISVVVENLIENAINYTLAGGTITVEVTGNEKETHFSIKDTGIGIPPDSQDKIFGKFYRAPNAITLYAHSSGLGLYISREIIEAHGGKLWFEKNSDGPGTTFCFTLPYLSSKE